MDGFCRFWKEAGLADSLTRRGRGEGPTTLTQSEHGAQHARGGTERSFLG